MAMKQLKMIRLSEETLPFARGQPMTLSCASGYKIEGEEVLMCGDDTSELASCEPGRYFVCYGTLNGGQSKRASF